MTIEQIVNELGGSTESVALKLREYECYGERKSSSKCPLAKFIKLKTGVDYVGVTLQYIRVSTHLDELRIFCLPKFLQCFVENFDQGLYPELLQIK